MKATNREKRILSDSIIEDRLATVEMKAKLEDLREKWRKRVDRIRRSIVGQPKEHPLTTYQEGRKQALHTILKEIEEAFP